MYKVMIVDDEPIVRLAIKSLVNWEVHGFIFDLEASNGKQAIRLQVFLCPDHSVITINKNVNIAI